MALNFPDKLSLCDGLSISASLPVSKQFVVQIEKQSLAGKSGLVKVAGETDQRQKL